MIPDNVEHGEELMCSYFACRNAGIKFRYCAHCKVPVGKYSAAILLAFARSRLLT